MYTFITKYDLIKHENRSGNLRNFGYYDLFSENNYKNGNEEKSRRKLKNQHRINQNLPSNQQSLVNDIQVMLASAPTMQANSPSQNNFMSLINQNQLAFKNQLSSQYLNNKLHIKKTDLQDHDEIGIDKSRRKLQNQQNVNQNLPSNQVFNQNSNNNLNQKVANNIQNMQGNIPSQNNFMSLMNQNQVAFKNQLSIQQLNNKIHRKKMNMQDQFTPNNNNNNNNNNMNPNPNGLISNNPNGLNTNTVSNVPAGNAVGAGPMFDASNTLDVNNIHPHRHGKHHHRHHSMNHLELSGNSASASASASSLAQNSNNFDTNQNNANLGHFGQQMMNQGQNSRINQDQNFNFPINRNFNQNQPLNIVSNNLNSAQNPQNTNQNQQLNPVSNNLNSAQNPQINNQNQQLNTLSNNLNSAQSLQKTSSGSLTNTKDNSISFNNFGSVDRKIWCFVIKQKYNIIPGQTFGNLPKNMHKQFVQANCDRYFCKDNPLSGKGKFVCEPI